MLYHSALAATFTVLTALGCSNSVSNPTPSGGPTPQETISILGQRGDQSFSPASDGIAQGTTVAWANKDSVTHHIVANDGSFETGDIAPGNRSSVVTFNAIQTDYHCSIHPTMTGIVRSSE